MSRIKDIFRGTTLSAGQAQGLAVFTICSNNYVDRARVLLDSVRSFHPDATLYLCLADARLPADDFYPEGCVVVSLEELEIPDLAAFVFRYDIMELNTAVKPFMFLHLLRAGHDTVLYFDSDIQVFSRLDQILAPLQDGASLVLTPHICVPAEGPDFPDDVAIMRTGTYNLGFLAARNCPETELVLNWWARRLQYQCLDEKEAGLFVDQKFMDLVPGFAAHACILRDPTVNVAYWNLAQRRLEMTQDGWTVDGAPLGFYHFSGFDPADMTRLSKYTSAFQGDAITPALRGLMRQFADRIHTHRDRRLPPALYAYARFESGRKIPGMVRRMFRERHIAWGLDPFSTYEEHLKAPLPGSWCGSASAIVTNLMGYLHAREPALQHAFDLTRPEGVRGFVEWFVRHGEPYLAYSGLTEPIAERYGRQSGTALRRPPPRRSADEADINVIGYLGLALGLGEAGRLTLRSLDHSGLRARGLDTALNSASKRADSSCDHLLDARADARFQLFSINCDQLPQVMQHLQPALRPDAYRIAAPFWELANLPDAWLPAIDLVDEIWAPTRFIQATFAKITAKPVLRMPLMLDFAAPAGVARSRFALPEGCFLFFFAFDYFSWIERKNPQAVIAAFKRAFRTKGGYPSIRLVLKTLNAGDVPETSQPLRDAVRNDPDIILIEELLSRDDTLALMAACDAIVTLHRSEGLGLLVAEAMVLGKPVISTDFSGTTDLVTPQTGWPVDCQLVPVREGAYPFHEGQLWADADIDHAAWQMRRVVEDAPEAARRASAARALISGEFGIGAVSARQLARLRLIEAQAAP